MATGLEELYANHPGPEEFQTLDPLNEFDISQQAAERVEYHDDENPHTSVQYKFQGIDDLWELWRYFIDPYKDGRYDILWNRSVLLRSIPVVAKEWGLPILNIESKEDHEFDQWNEYTHFYQITLWLGIGPWVRDNYALKFTMKHEEQRIYDEFPPHIVITISDMDEYPAMTHTSVEFRDIRSDYISSIAYIVDQMFNFWWDQLGQPRLTAKNVRERGKTILRQRQQEKVLGQWVSPEVSQSKYFPGTERRLGPNVSRMIAKMGEWNVPRRPIDPNLKATSPNLFEGGRRRKTRKAKKARRKTRVRRK